MDIRQISNIGRKISEAQLPYIGDGRQYSMPTYTLDYNAFKWIPTPISGPATWALGIAGMGLAEAPILFADNAIDTIVDGLPNVYNWAVDEYNVGASRRALNNYINNEGSGVLRQIQERGMGQVGPAANTPQTRLTGRRITYDMNPALYNMITEPIQNAVYEPMPTITVQQKMEPIYGRLRRDTSGPVAPQYNYYLQAY